MVCVRFGETGKVLYTKGCLRRTRWTTGICVEASYTRRRRIFSGKNPIDKAKSTAMLSRDTSQRLRKSPYRSLSERHFAPTIISLDLAAKDYYLFQLVANEIRNRTFDDGEGLFGWTSST